MSGIYKEAAKHDTYEKKIHEVKTDPEVTKMLELGGKIHLKVIITVYLKKLSGDMEI